VPPHPEDVDYRNPRGLDRALFQKLIEGEWITAHDNLALTGPTGIGKSWLAAALGHKACRDNRSVPYQRVPRLFEDLALAPSPPSAQSGPRRSAHPRWALQSEQPKRRKALTSELPPGQRWKRRLPKACW